MGLEAATYIHELDTGNPVGASDPKGQGDDHLKLIKSTLQNTFPNIEGEMTASHTELNKLDGVTASTADLNATTNLSSRFGGLKVAFGTLNSGTNNAALDSDFTSKNITSVTHANGSGSYTIDYTAAGFTKIPNIQVTVQNQSIAGLRVNTVFNPTTTSVSINLQNNSGVASDGEFYFFAIGE